jgi:hypothetical protein
MSIIREKIKFLNATGLTLNFGLSSNDGFLGYQQEIDNLTQTVSNDLINPDVDVEERRFKYIPNIGPTTLQFNFHYGNGNSWLNSFYPAGFTTNDIFGLSQAMLNSFFIMSFYDTYDVNTQTKIFTTYLTKLIGSDAYGNKTYIPSYIINSGIPNQLYYWYVPVWYINSQTGTTVTGYTNFTFYNAKSGTTALFYNYDNESLSTSEKMYFKTELNLVNKTWKILTPLSHNNVVIARQLWTSPSYNTRVDNTVQNFNNEQQNYPSGSTFVYLDGKYV